MSNPIDGLRLNASEGSALKVQTEHWRCDGIYLSDICLAAHLMPLQAGDLEALKADLRALLRGLGQLALRNNLWRPIVGVIEDASGQLGHLGADQEWHRGDFLVFVEEGDSTGRLADLLLPGQQLPALRRERVEPRDPAWFRRELEQGLARSEQADSIRGLVEILLPAPKPGQSQTAAADTAITEGFAGWRRRIREQADRIAAAGEDT